VNQLIAEAEAGRLLNSKELADVIAGCIRSSSQDPHCYDPAAVPQEEAPAWCDSRAWAARRRM